MKEAEADLDRRGRGLVLAAAFLGWMFAGVEMSLMVSATRPAIQDFLGAGFTEALADKWFSWYLASFLLGAAVGGALFGWVGDCFGRVRAMGLSILCYSLMTGVSWWVTTPESLLLWRFLACMGVGGMWPAGVSLVSEAWPSVSRPLLAGLIGTAANVGFLILGLLMLAHPVTRDTWRWVLLFGASPVFLGIWVLWAVPESPMWLQSKCTTSETAPSKTPLRDVFRPPLLRRTLLGIALGTIPLLGGWASGQRLVPWAGQTGDAVNMPHLKATTQVIWAVGAVIGSLGGGWMAERLGRRRSYFLISLFSFLLSAFLFLGTKPGEAFFLPATFALALISISFFGWLPYYLPELFPTGVRATGSGVSYNFGRILSAAAVLATATLSDLFDGDLAKMGAATSVVYLFGLVLVFFIPARPVTSLSVPAGRRP